MNRTLETHTYPQYCTWTDETLSGKSVVNSGLKYGVYNHLTDNKHYIESVTITSYHQAQQLCNELNAKLKDPYTF